MFTKTNSTFFAAVFSIVMLTNFSDFLRTFRYFWTQINNSVLIDQ